MAKYTNKHGLPDPLFKLLGRESYSRGDSRRSATQLIDSPRAVALKERHKDDLAQEIDVSDRIWALFGTAVHKLIEDGLPHSDWHMAEERIFTEVNGWKISGAIDLQVLGEGEGQLIDWKVCSIWSVFSQGEAKQKPEWVKQLNVLAYFIEREKGIAITGLKVGALIRDWNRNEAARNAAYPQAPFHMVDIPLWDYAVREEFVRQRVRLHQEAEIALALGDEPEPCTPDEMWVRDEKWAVNRTGLKRAVKVFDTEAEARDFIQNDSRPLTLSIEHRAGERTRCARFCEAAAFCSLAPKPETDDNGF